MEVESFPILLQLSGFITTYQEATHKHFNKKVEQISILLRRGVNGALHIILIFIMCKHFYKYLFFKALGILSPLGKIVRMCQHMDW